MKSNKSLIASYFEKMMEAFLEKKVCTFFIKKGIEIIYCKSSFIHINIFRYFTTKHLRYYLKIRQCCLFKI